MNKIPSFIRYDLPVLARMFLPVFFLGVLFLNYHEFIITAIKANKAINSGIIVAAIFGIILIYSRLLCLQGDMRGLDRFNREAMATGDMKQLLDMPWLSGSAVSHYLAHIAYTEGHLVSQLDQDAIQNELEALSEEYGSKMELPQFLVGFMVALGLLGTFIGLLETLTGISGMLSGMGHGGDIQSEFSKLVVELRRPLAGMGIAFSASMFGLVASLMLSVMMTMLRRYTSRVLEKARSVMHNLLSRMSQESSEQALSPQDMMGDVVQQMRESFLSMSSNINLLAQKMDVVTSTLEKGVRSSQEGIRSVAPVAGASDEASFMSSDSMISVMSSVNLLARRMEAVTKSLENNIGETQKTNSLLNFGPRMAESNEKMADNIKTMVSSQEEGMKSLQKIINSLIQIDQSLMTNSTKDLLTSQRESVDSLGELSGCAQTQIRLFSELLESQRSDSRALQKSLRNLNENMHEQGGVHLGSSKHLFEIKEKIGAMSGSLSLIDMVAENIGRQTLLLENVLLKDKEKAASFEEVGREQEALSTLVAKPNGEDEEGDL